MGIVNLRDAKVGDYVMFRCKGVATIKSIQDSGSVDEDFPIEIFYEGYDDDLSGESYTPAGFIYNNVHCPLDIIEVVPAFVMEAALKGKSNE